MKIKEEKIDIENIEEILNRELNDVKQSRNSTELFTGIKRQLYNIFNTVNNNKEEELKKLKDSIDTIRELLVEILYGNHELI